MISVNTPLFDGNEKRYLCECIDSAWISHEGAFVERFEEAFAVRVGRRYGVSVCNGTAALEVAIAALGLSQGDEVILPSFTIISCVIAVLRAGAKPVFVDSDAGTWNMDVDQVEARITGRTRAIMPVHTYGLPVDMDPLLALARRHGLHIIEDAAQAHGLKYRGRPCGGFGDIAIFSFYPNKLITTGEGGMVVTDDVLLAERCRHLRNLCFKTERRFFHEELGWNYRMSNLQAALGLAQLEQIDRFIGIKRRMGRWYNDRLGDLAGVQAAPVCTDYAENVYWVYGLVLADSVPFEATEAMRRLSAYGIGTRPFFWPMHEQPVLRRMGFGLDQSLPVAERLARRGFYLPSGLNLSTEEIEKVSECVRELMAMYGQSS